MDNIFAGLFVFLFIGVIIAAVVLLPAYIFMLVWNYVMPQVFGLPELNFWLAFCLLWIIGIVTKLIRGSNS